MQYFLVISAQRERKRKGNGQGEKEKEGELLVPLSACFITLKWLRSAGDQAPAVATSRCGTKSAWIFP